MTDSIHRVYLALTIIVMTAMTTMAQTHYSSKVAVGIHGGATASWMGFTPAIKELPVVGKTVGIALKYWEERNFGIIGEVNYTQRGWREDLQGSQYSFQRTIDYVEVPLLTHVFFDKGVTRVFFNAGPQVSRLIGSKATANFNVDDIASLPDFPGNRVTEQMTLNPHYTFDYGICGGAGVELMANKRNSFTLEARYYFGIGNIFADTRRDSFAASRAMSIQVMAGYSFRVK